MHWEYLLSAIYIVAFLWFVPRGKFSVNSGLTVRELRLLIMAKMLIAVVCAWYFAKVLVKVDYMETNNEGMLQYQLLISDPGLFFTDFKTDISQYGLGRIFDTSGSFWGYFRFIVVFKLLAFLNFITRGNFYLNSIIFSSLVFFGHLCFYRIYNEMYPGKKILKILVCFFLPSLLLYTSCAHKDGLVFLSHGIAGYVFFCLLTNPGKIGIKKLLFFIGALLCIFLLRNYVLVALLPAMAITFVAGKLSRYRLWAVIGMYLLAMIIFFSTALLPGSLNLPAAVVNRKADFALLEKGGTGLNMKELEPTLKGFTRNTPQALNHVLLRPYPNEFANKGALLASLELYGYLALMAAFFLFGKRRNFTSIHLFNIYGMAFFVSMVLIIGFTIPNAGAIVRYRSLLWIFVLCPLVCNFPWPKKWQAYFN